MNNQISNNTVLKTQINSRSKRAKRFRRKRERKSSKRESESSSSDNSNPPNHESYQSSIANFHVLPYSPPAPMPPSRIPLIIGWRKGQADCSLAGNRIPVASSISGCEPSFPPRVSRRIRLGGLVSRRVGNVARDRRGASAFQPFPHRKFSRAMSSEIDSRPQLPDKSDINARGIV